MAVEAGRNYQAKVTKITNFGAFVQLESGEKGLVHISEIAAGFVKDIREHLSVGEEVTVRVLKVQENGKISFSIRKALEPAGEKAAEDKHPDPKKQRESPAFFEEKMNRFLKESEERLAVLRKKTAGQPGSQRENNQQD
ncbi:S1 RNA-binding domain-containing protein [Alkalicoccus halolimnae]|uniref:S1 RNA-binding domain-containing protein n=1 Tax=Alkalicoccus halolimnae TaxID=1667239 RepID=A0A5C7FEE1_9BACI|nr:S1 RNA-binding domain-containing protein [Alkalicoccus halolimnae]TXF82122.1 S1 RNA-binding domain-containing protein [Alkalicoccus halolimnae]